MLEADVEAQFAALERAAAASRAANQEVLEGHLATSAVVIAQRAALVAQGVLQQTPFPGVDGAPA